MYFFDIHRTITSIFSSKYLKSSFIQECKGFSFPLNTVQKEEKNEFASLRKDTVIFLIHFSSAYCRTLEKLIDLIH